MKHFGHHGHNGRHKGPLARLKRRATYLLTLLVVIAGGYLAFSAWGDFSLTGATTGVPVDGGSQEFSVNAHFVMPDKGFEMNDVTLKITLGEAQETFSGGKLLIDGLNMESFQGASVILNGYEGSLAGSGGLLKLNGKVTSAIMNNVVINKNGAPITVETSDLQFDSVLASDISVKSFSLVSTGSVDVADKGSFSVNDEKVVMKPFNGMVTLDDAGLTLSGVTGNLMIESVPRISVE